MRPENDETEHLESIEPESVFDEPPTDPDAARLRGLVARTRAFDSKAGETVRPVGPGTPEPMVLDLSEDDTLDSDASTSPHESGMGLSWDYVRRTSPTSLGLRLRALAECLSALGALHTDLRSVPGKRFHGAVWYGNLMIRQNGSALLLKGENLTPQPSAYAAPELKQGRPDQQADVYAVGVMLLEALCEQPLRAREVAELAGADLSTHPFWARLADDPLLWVALRAVARDPARRWPSAREFADALIQCSFDKMVSKQQLGGLIGLVLAEQADRATPVLGPGVAGPRVEGLTAATLGVAESGRASELSGTDFLLSEELHAAVDDRAAIAPEPLGELVSAVGTASPHRLGDLQQFPRTQGKRSLARSLLLGGGVVASLAACLAAYALYLAPSGVEPAASSPGVAAERVVSPSSGGPLGSASAAPSVDPNPEFVSEPEASMEASGARKEQPAPSASVAAKPAPANRARPASRKQTEFLPEATQRPASSKPNTASRYEPEGI